MKLTEIAKNLLLWSSTHLTKDASLKKSDLALFFESAFKVEANGRHYEASHDNYFEFLNEFRSSIRSIDYEPHDFIEHGDKVVIAFTARIVRTSDESENFEAILILKFNQRLKIVLWREVYART
jgi:hypothetical protein